MATPPLLEGKVVTARKAKVLAHSIKPNRWELRLNHVGRAVLAVVIDDDDFKCRFTTSGL